MNQALKDEHKFAAEQTPQEAADAYIQKCAGKIASKIIGGDAQNTISPRAYNLARAYQGFETMLPEEMRDKIIAQVNAQVEMTKIIASLEAPASELKT